MQYVDIELFKMMMTDEKAKQLEQQGYRIAAKAGGCWGRGGTDASRAKEMVV